MQSNNLHQLISNLFENFAKDVIPKTSSAPTNENQSIGNLVSLFLAPSLQSDPRSIMRSMSDNLVEHIVLNRGSIPNHPMMKMIFQLFLIEWCYRNDYMEEDWKWEWNKDGKNGEALINPRIPMNQIPLPQVLK